jgi:hypothetical protein
MADDEFDVLAMYIGDDEDDSTAEKQFFQIRKLREYDPKTGSSGEEAGTRDAC